MENHMIDVYDYVIWGDIIGLEDGRKMIAEDMVRVCLSYS